MGNRKNSGRLFCPGSKLPNIFKPPPQHHVRAAAHSPQDVWSWVVLANLYIREKRDKETGEKFVRKALEIAPNDAWALNSLATLTYERGEFDAAVDLYEKAIVSNPDFANSYYGKAVVFNKSGQTEKALESLDRLFSRAKSQDVRSKPVYEVARRLFAKLQGELAARNESEAFKLVENFRAGLETLSGYPVRVTEGEFKDKTSATIQMAWKHNRDHHLIKFRTGLPADLRTHQLAHELSHLQLEAEARQAGKNRFFTTTHQSEQTALQRIEGDIRKLERKGYPAAVSKDLALALIRGLAGFLFNCPLDMVIETRLRDKIPALSAVQFGALRMGALEALESQRNPEILEVTPKLILRAGAALNGAYALFLDNFFQGATEYALAYRQAESFATSQRLFQHWQTRGSQLGPGDEYALVDEFADMVGVRGWYEWKLDPGAHTVAPSATKEGTTNPDLLRRKNMPAVYFCLDAIKRFDTMTAEQVREIAMEIGLAGREGLDYASPDQKYTLKSLPDEKFSGLHLMCLMFAGFKRIAPEHDLQMDLNEPFLTALEMFQKGETGAEG